MGQLQPSHDLERDDRTSALESPNSFRTVHSWPGIRGDGHAGITARRHLDDNVQFVLVGSGPNGGRAN